MNICSLSFLYLFLPGALFLCAVTPSRHRPATLLLLSLLFYYFSERGNLWLMLAVLLSDWMLAGILVRSRSARLRKIFIAFAAVKNVGLIAGYSLFAQHIPLGLSVYCLTSMGYVIDCYHGFALWERNPTRVLLMGSFFPKLYAGPIVYYSRTAAQFFTLRMSLAHIGEGGGIFLIGLCKKVILGDGMRGLFESLHAIPPYEISSLGIWSMLVSLAFAFYFSLWGLCDMAKGLALMFGFEIPDNFDNPFLSKSINEFFARFNITINRFIRRHVYMTLGGAHGNVLSVIFNILLLSILMAIWFGMTWNLLAWGIFLALFVLVERFLLPHGWKNTAAFFQWLYCMAVVAVSLIFVAGGSLGESFTYLRVLFGTAPGVDDKVIYLLVSNYLVLLLCIISASGLPQKLTAALKRYFPIPTAIGSALLNFMLLTAATAYLL